MSCTLFGVSAGGSAGRILSILQVGRMLSVSLQVFRFIENSDEPIVKAFGPGGSRWYWWAQIYLLESWGT